MISFFYGAFGKKPTHQENQKGSRIAGILLLTPRLANVVIIGVIFGPL